MFFKKKRSGEAVLPPYEVWKDWSDAEWADFKKNLNGKYVELPREEWEDWTKKDWIEHQTPEEQAQLKALSDHELGMEFQDWCLGKLIEKQKRDAELRAQGVIPPLKEPSPQYGNRSVAITNYYNANDQYVGYGSSYDDN